MLLIDADILLYKSAVSAEQEIDWGDDVWSLQTDLKDAKQAFDEQVQQITDELNDDDMVFCLSDRSGNFRKLVDPTYKSNRKGTRKPLGYVALYDWLRSSRRTFSKPMLEADDCLGIMATMPANRGKCIIVSDDKDLKTIPGDLYRPMSNEKLAISEAAADANFYTQVLCGDVTDGYKGVPGIGPKKAETVLGSRPSWGAVEQAFTKAGMTREDAIQQASLARILRWSDWD